MDVYENAMVEARVAFANRINRLVKVANSENLGFFLVYYAALGSAIHESMEKIFKKAAKRCKKMDFANLAEAFEAQASVESKQAEEMKSDTKIWIDWWNQRQSLDLSAKDYLRHPTMPSMQVIQDLHQDVVEHQVPFAELAIAYEMQRTDTIHSFTLIKLAIFKLGLSALRRLGFVRRAAKLTTPRVLNKNLLAGFLKQHPEAVKPMIEKSCLALEAYAEFLDDCFRLANNEAEKYQCVAT
ncbi:MAG: hypothetical protein KDH94_07670 [Coxiellaceae bacterium]|nr:hypothetical protein [Coxiellaceae bacterium]